MLFVRSCSKIFQLEFLRTAPQILLLRRSCSKNFQLYFSSNVFVRKFLKNCSSWDIQSSMLSFQNSFKEIDQNSSIFLAFTVKKIFWDSSFFQLKYLPRTAIFFQLSQQNHFPRTAPFFQLMYLPRTAISQNSSADCFRIYVYHSCLSSFCFSKSLDGKASNSFFFN